MATVKLKNDIWVYGHGRIPAGTELKLAGYGNSLSATSFKKQYVRVEVGKHQYVRLSRKEIE